MRCWSEVQSGEGCRGRTELNEVNNEGVMITIGALEVVEVEGEGGMFWNVKNEGLFNPRGGINY